MLQPAATSVTPSLALTPGSLGGTAENLEIPEGFAALLALGLTSGAAPEGATVTVSEPAIPGKRQTGKASGNAGGNILPVALPQGDTTVIDPVTGLAITPDTPATSDKDASLAGESLPTPVAALLSFALPAAILVPVAPPSTAELPAETEPSPRSAASESAAAPATAATNAATAPLLITPAIAALPSVRGLGATLPAAAPVEAAAASPQPAQPTGDTPATQPAATGTAPQPKAKPASQFQLAMTPAIAAPDAPESQAPVASTSPATTATPPVTPAAIAPALPTLALAVQPAQAASASPGQAAIEQPVSVAMQLAASLPARSDKVRAAKADAGTPVQPTAPLLATESVAAASPATPTTEPVLKTKSTATSAPAAAPQREAAADPAPVRGLAAKPELATIDMIKPLAAELQPVMAMRDAQPIIHGGSATPVTTSAAPAQPGSHDFAALVDRLVEARDAAMPHAVRAAIQHSEFGQVSLRFQADDSRLSVAMTSADPGFAPAVQAAAAAAQAGTNSDSGTSGQRQDQRQDSQGQQSQQAGSAASNQSQAQSQAQSQSQNSARSAERERNESLRQSANGDAPGERDEPGPGRRGSIYA